MAALGQPNSTATLLETINLDQVPTLTLAAGSFIAGSSTSGITAHAGGGGTSAVQLTSATNQISTVAADHDSVKAPPAVAGIEVAIDNDGTHILDIYPNGTDQIEDSTNPISILAGADITLVCSAAGKYYLQGTGATASIPAGAALTVASFMSGSTILLDTAAGSVATLPAATGSNSRYLFVVKTTASSNAHKILPASVSDFIQGVAVGHIAAGTTLTFQGNAAASHSIQMPFAGTQPSGGFAGDWFEFIDVAANLWEVRGMYQSGTTSTTPFSTATT